MNTETIEQLIARHFPEAECHVEGDGYHFMATIVSDRFAGQSMIKRQQAVYACFKDEIAAGDIHALSLKVLTPEERGQQKNKPR
ncbi:MAG: BolA/IbaG family iron-sulfur metabolism protein [Pseudomonadota bacterium]